MALLWMDGFDQYGEDETLPLDGIYASFPSSTTLSNTGARTGSYCLATTVPSPSGLLKSLNFSGTTVGAAGAWNMGDGTPANGTGIIEFRNSSSSLRCALETRTDGGLTFAVSGQPDINSAAGVLTASIYNHIEISVTLSTSATGSVEVRVNGVAVINSTNVITSVTDTNVSQVEWTPMEGSAASAGYLDDIFAWDGSGTDNNDFLGMKHVVTLVPNGDTAQADWTGAYTDIDEIPPDDDTTYIVADDTSLPRTSEFALSNLPTEYTNIAGVLSQMRVRKDSVGTAEARMTMVSAAATSAGTLNSVGDTYAYFSDIHEQDPNTSAAWTESGLNNALLRIGRET